LLDGNTKPVTGDSTRKMFSMVITETQVGAKSTYDVTNLHTAFQRDTKLIPF